MAQFVGTQTEQLVAPNQNAQLTGPTLCPCGNIIHNDGTGIVMLRGGHQYTVGYSANIAVPEGGTAGAIALALSLNGETVQGTRGIVTPAAVQQYFHVGGEFAINVPCGCCYSVAVRNVDAGVGSAIEAQAVSIADLTLTVV